MRRKREMGAIRQSWQQARTIRPGRVRQEAERKFTLAIAGVDEADRMALAQVFAPPGGTREQRTRAARSMMPAESALKREGTIRVRTPRAFGSGVEVDPADPEPGLRALLRAAPGYRMALAHTFPPLRELLAPELIRAVAARNATVAAVSALPEVIPNPLSLIVALGEMGSDTVLITANQIGLCFHLAALRGERVGWSAQAGRVAGILLSALGWRTLARELVGIVPAGIGLAAKAGLAYSGTMAVGAALWKTSGQRADQRRETEPLPLRRTSHQPTTLAIKRQSA